MIGQNVLIKLVIHKKLVVGGRIYSHKWINMLRSSDATRRHVSHMVNGDTFPRSGIRNESHQNP